MKKVRYATYLRSKEVGHSNRYTSGTENNSFSGQLRTGIGLAIIFDPV